MRFYQLKKKTKSKNLLIILKKGSNLMASVIEKSLQEYEAYLNGEPNEVEVVEVSIPVVTEFNIVNA